MTKSGNGPFYSTLDADSEGVEGKFYVWTPAEIEQILGKEESDLFGAAYSVEPEGNWTDEAGHGPPGPTNILHRVKTIDQLARLNRRAGDRVAAARLQTNRERMLFEVRNQRVWPGRDEKALTAWNGLMIAALAQAGAVLENPRYVEAARRAADFILTRMRTGDGRLLRSWSSGSRTEAERLFGGLCVPGRCAGVLVRSDVRAARWVESAWQVVEVMVDQFWDDAEGGFFYTGRDHETLIARNKDPHDNAIPSGNAMAVTALLKLVKLTGRVDLQEKAEATLKLYANLLATQPTAAGQMLVALDFHLGPVQEFAVVGDPANEETRRVLRTFIRGGFLAERHRGWH